MTRLCTLVSRVAAISVVTALTCCASPGEERTGESIDNTHALVGAFPATDPSLAAVGALAVVRSEEGLDEPPVVVCTGALIGTSTVVTAKHCLDAPSDFGEGFRLVFLFGVDGSVPTHRVEILASEGAPQDHGGYNGYGADVGVLHLREPVRHVAPLRIASLQAGMVGTDFLAVGYGAMDNSQAYGRRRVGTIKLKAIAGPTYEALLGSFEAYYEFETSVPLAPECDTAAGLRLGDLLQARSARCETAVAMRGVFDAYQLEQTGEVAAGGFPGDAQPCSGDSGGPLLLRGADGALTVYGVVSGGLASRSLECAYGAIYASFSPEVLTFLQTSVHWRDPCAKLPPGGMCDGNTARRCTTPLEGPRLALAFDCSRVGALCKLSSDGMVGCGSALEPNTAALPVIRPASSHALVHNPLLFDSRVFLAPGERTQRSAAVR
jgi:hypothetical protein